MQTTFKGYVLRIYPTDKQKELINKTIGCARFIYNHFLDEKISDYKDAVSKDQLKIAKGFLKFQQETIEKLKEYL